MVPKARARAKTSGSRKFRSLAVSDSFKAFVLDQLDELGEVSAKSMFGGVGLYCDGVFFGLIARDALYLKADAVNRPDFEQRRAEPFRPYGDRRGSKHYFAVPIDVLESAIDLAAWSRKAVAAARRGKR